MRYFFSFRSGKLLWSAWRLVFIPVTVLLLVFVIPTGWAFWISLHDYGRALYNPPFNGFTNYYHLLHDQSFVHSVVTTLLFCGVTLPLMMAIGLQLAIMLAMPLAGLYWLRLWVYLPVILPLVAVSITWQGLYAEDGWINRHLAAYLGVRVPFLTHPNWALWAIILMILWKGAGYYGMMLLTQLLQREPQLYEAARLDGAGSLAQFWHLTLPYLKPALSLAATICLLGCFKSFTEFYVMTRGGPLESTTTWLYWVYHKGFERLDLGLACAGGLLLMMAVALLAWGQYRITQQPEQ